MRLVMETDETQQCETPDGKAARVDCPTRGRPREFDVDLALDSALSVFWKKGYEGTSLTDLTEAMRITRPSLYAAFGSKEELFHKVLVRYAAGPASFVAEALTSSTAREVAERLVGGTIDMLSCPSNPHGCLMVQAALSSGDEAESVKEELATYRIARETAIRRRFEEARNSGDLPADTDPTDLARYVAVVMQGLAVEAANGATRTELLRAAEIALSCWPSA